MRKGAVCWRTRDAGSLHEALLDRIWAPLVQLGCHAENRKTRRARLLQSQGERKCVGWACRQPDEWALCFVARTTRRTRISSGRAARRQPIRPRRLRPINAQQSEDAASIRVMHSACRYRQGLTQSAVGKRLRRAARTGRSIPAPLPDYRPSVGR